MAKASKAKKVPVLQDSIVVLIVAMLMSYEESSQLACKVLEKETVNDDDVFTVLSLLLCNYVATTDGANDNLQSLYTNESIDEIFTICSKQLK
jgi:hypothetical protein